MVVLGLMVRLVIAPFLGVARFVKWLKDRRTERLLAQQAGKVRVGQSVHTGVYAARKEGRTPPGTT